MDYRFFAPSDQTPSGKPKDFKTHSRFDPVRLSIGADTLVVSSKSLENGGAGRGEEGVKNPQSK